MKKTLRLRKSIEVYCTDMLWSFAKPGFIASIVVPWISSMSTLFLSGQAMAGVIFQDNFSTGDISKKLNGVAFWTDNSSNYQQPSATKLSTITVQPEAAGGYSLRALYAGTTNPAEGARPELRFNLGGQYPEYWVSFDLFIPLNYTHRIGNPVSNDKFFITDNNVGSQFIDRETFPDYSYGSGVDVGSTQLKYNGVNYGFQGPASTWQFVSAADRGTWAHYVLHHKVATSATSNDGVAQTWKNGALVQSFTNFPNYTPGANYFEEGYIFGASNSGFAVDTELRLDNIVFSDSPVGTSAPAAPDNLMVR